MKKNELSLGSNQAVQHDRRKIMKKNKFLLGASVLILVRAVLFIALGVLVWYVFSLLSSQDDWKAMDPELVRKTTMMFRLFIFFCFAESGLNVALGVMGIKQQKTVGLVITGAIFFVNCINMFITHGMFTSMLASFVLIICAAMLIYVVFLVAAIVDMVKVNKKVKAILNGELPTV